jgi:hypothetical protein
LIGWRLLVGVRIAQDALDAGATEKDRAFYTGKVAVAKFFAHNMLPMLSSIRGVIESIDNDVMELDRDAF